MTDSTDATTPVRHLSWIDAVAVVMGIVIGSGIFMAPAMVAMFTDNATQMLTAWVLGGLLCLCGALCYAELAAMHPHAGGEYVYLTQAFGKPMGFFFVWARTTVIQTGSIAAAAYIFGVYAAKLLPIGPASPLLYALSATAILTALNAVGLRTEKWTQNLLTAAKLLGIAAIVAVAFWAAPAEGSAATDSAPSGGGKFGLAMVFVLYAFGGWNEAAYVAGEVRHARRHMLRVLIVSIAALTALYLAVNLAYLHVLGLEGMRGAGTIAADTVKAVLGPHGATAVSVLVAISALGAMNGCIFTGSRAVWAVGSDFPAFRSLAQWHRRFRTPFNAIVLQGAIAVVLILLPGISPYLREKLGSGFEAAVSYTAPVFWTFLLLTGLSLLVLRLKDPTARRPFRVPLYPLPVFALIAMSGYMVYSSLVYVKTGAMLGLGVLAAGLPAYLLLRRSGRRA